MAIFFRIPEVCQKSKFSASFFVPLKLFTGCPPSSLTGGLIPLFRLSLSNSVLYWKRKQTSVCFLFQYSTELEEETDRCLRADAKPQNKKFGGNEYEIRTYL